MQIFKINDVRLSFFVVIVQATNVHFGYKPNLKSKSFFLSFFII